MQFQDGEIAGERAPIPDDPQVLADNLKASCYFLDAAAVGVCAAPVGVWYRTGDDGQPLAPYSRNAVVILVEHGRAPEPDNAAAAWLDGSTALAAALRAAEIAVVLAGYVRRLGFAARAHAYGHSDVDHAVLVVRAGLGQARDGAVINPYLGVRYASAIVTTDLPVAPDLPLAVQPLRDRRLATLLGIGGAKSGIERWSERRRPSHESRYPMARISRVARPTTLILEDEVPRVPKRAAFFERALRGDLGDKTKRERTRFALKHPFADAMAPLLRDMVAYQDGPVAAMQAPGTEDAAVNTRAVKALGYFLNADLIGICEAKAYARYSHDADGNAIPLKHKYAVVMLIDQGHETMEGASGDDWISGAQSMRGYLRGAEIFGQVAALIRGLGHAARSQTNLDSDVL